MSRTAATMNPGSTNRRFIMLAVFLGLVGAVLVYVAFSRTSDDPTSSGGVAADTPIVVAKADIPARTKITAGMVEVRLVSADARSALGYDDPEAVIGEVTRFPIAQNEQVLSNKIVPLSGGTSVAAARSLSYIIPPGKRGFAIKVSEVAGAGGLVLPGDYIDVVVIYDVEFGDKKADAYLVQTVLQNIEVLAVSQVIVDVVQEATPTAGGQRERITEAKPDPGANTVTLSLTPEQAQRVYLAEGNGTIRLAVRSYGDATDKPIDYMTELDLYPQNLPNPFQR